MDNIEVICYNSLQNYYKALSLYGFKSDADVSKLLALLFIKDFLRHFSGMFTGAELTMIGNAIYCLINSTCLIEDVLVQRDYYSYQYNVYDSASARIDEDFVIRIAEESGTRVVE